MIQSGLNAVRDLIWEEVFSMWYENEGTNENWAKLASKRGYASWAQWRYFGYAMPFECKNAKWGLYEVSNPTEAIGHFFGAPFRTWIERHYEGEKTRQFSELAKRQEIRDHEAVKSMIKNFPKEKTILCLLVGARFFVIEGMHRSCALAVMHDKGIKLDEKLTLAIGMSDLKELPVVGQVDK